MAQQGIQRPSDDLRGRSGHSDGLFLVMTATAQHVCKAKILLLGDWWRLASVSVSKRTEMSTAQKHSLFGSMRGALNLQDLWIFGMQR